MIKHYKNAAGNIEGDYNTVIQIIVSEGKNIGEKLGVLIDSILAKDKKEKSLLEGKIADLERIIKDGDTLKGYQEKDIFQLKSQLAEKELLIEKNEERYAGVLLDLNGKDLTKADKLYAAAYKTFLAGEIQAAINILSRQKLLEAKLVLDKEKEENAKAWLFKATLLISEEKYTTALNECYEMAVEINPTWENCLEAANHFKFINNFTQAGSFYNFCLLKSKSDYQKATTLNNLANLQSDQNEYEKAEGSYEEALSIRRKLAEVNPQTYLPDVGMTQINMAIFYQHSQVDKVLSLKLVDAAIANLWPFRKIPYIQNYLKVAFKVLEGWEIDVEEYLKEKNDQNKG